ncbi:MAG: glucose-6-phosphate isomerase [Deltaproteobacteria bacterium]
MMRKPATEIALEDRQILSLGPYERDLQDHIALLEQKQFASRLWQKDPTLWKTDPGSRTTIPNGLGWLHGIEKMEGQMNHLFDFASEVRAAGFRHVLDMGMGGSTLAPLAIQHIFPTGQNGIPLTVLDTTDPETILKIERQMPMADTLFIVASKSGTTAENVAFGEYFYAKVKALKGNRAGENFVAITDPGTPLVELAKERGFRKTFLNFPDIGGRFSALSYFGLVPAALMGVDIAELLVRSLRMKQACGPRVPAKENPGMTLGAVMGALARRGRDKVTLLLPDNLATLGMWLEQLLAESTGKEGTGILPVAGEIPISLSVYGEDRLFVYIRLKDEVDESLEQGIAALQKAGQPVVTLLMDDRLDLGQEFFRWEIATATAGAILGINPFDQPNVQESKDITNRLLEEVRKTGKLSAPSPVLREEPLRFYGTQQEKTGGEVLKAFFNQARTGDYVALQAYLPETLAITEALQGIRMRLRDRRHLPTTLGYGPRFLHSTGQYHKGGTNTGLFLQLTVDTREDAPVPGSPYTFGVLRAAQGLGDFEALQKHGRRVVRIHLGADPIQGLAALSRELETVLPR